MRSAILAFAMLAAGCGDGYVSGAAVRIDTWHDDKNKVTCWVASGSGGQSITCLPDAALTPPAQSVAE